jgi:hypothetical protein
LLLYYFTGLWSKLLLYWCYVFVLDLIHTLRCQPVMDLLIVNKLKLKLREVNYSRSVGESEKSLERKNYWGQGGDFLLGGSQPRLPVLLIASEWRRRRKNLWKKWQEAGAAASSGLHCLCAVILTLPPAPTPDRSPLHPYHTVGTTARLQIKLRDGGSILGRGNRYFSSANRPHWLWFAAYGYRCKAARVSSCPLTSI